MRALTILPLLILPAAILAHDDPGKKPGEAPTTPVITGNGEWTFEAVPGWGVLPDGKNIGPTHGSVIVGPDDRVYMSTESEMAIIVWEADGTFVKTIAPDCPGFHAMAINEEDGKHVIYGAQNNGRGNKSRQAAGSAHGPHSDSTMSRFFANS